MDDKRSLDGVFDALADLSKLRFGEMGRLDQLVEVFADGFLVVEGGRDVGLVRAVLLLVGLHLNNGKFEESAKCSRDRWLQAGTHLSDELGIIQVLDRFVKFVDKSLLLDNIVALADDLACHQDNHVGVNQEDA